MQTLSLLALVDLLAPAHKDWGRERFGGDGIDRSLCFEQNNFRIGNKAAPFDRRSSLHAQSLRRLEAKCQRTSTVHRKIVQTITAGERLTELGVVKHGDLGALNRFTVSIYDAAPNHCDALGIDRIWLNPRLHRILPFVEASGGHVEVGHNGRIQRFCAAGGNGRSDAQLPAGTVRAPRPSGRCTTVGGPLIAAVRTTSRFGLPRPPANSRYGSSSAPGGSSPATADRRFTGLADARLAPAIAPRAITAPCESSNQVCNRTESDRSSQTSPRHKVLHRNTSVIGKRLPQSR